MNSREVLLHNLGTDRHQCRPISVEKVALVLTRDLLPDYLKLLNS